MRAAFIGGGNMGSALVRGLLAHGAKSFPVEVHGQESAQRLHQLAGVGEEPKTLEHLFAVPAADS